MRFLCLGEPPVVICAEIHDVWVEEAPSDVVSLGGAPVGAAAAYAHEVLRACAFKESLLAVLGAVTVHAHAVTMNL